MSSSAMVMLADVVAPSVAPPVTSPSVTVKVSLPSTAVSFAMVTLQVLLAASPSAQFSVTAPAV